MVAISGAGWRLAPCLVTLDREVTAAFPDRDHTSDGSIGDAAHASRDSDHNPDDGWVDALDIDEDLSAATHSLMPFAERLRFLQDPRVKYLIYEGHICKSYVDSAGHPAWEWYPYVGLNDHAHHLHVSVEADGRFDVRSWGVASAYTTAPASAPADAPTPEPEQPLVSFFHCTFSNRYYRVAGTHVKRIDDELQVWSLAVGGAVFVKVTTLACWRVITDFT